MLDINNVDTNNLEKNEMIEEQNKLANEESNGRTKKAKSAPFDTKKLVGVAMFAALAYAVTFVFRIPVMFLTFDAKDSLITLASLIYGPISGAAISLIVALVEAVSISGTGVYGFIMNFASSAAFSVTAGLIYKYKRNLSGAVMSFYVASLVMVGIMAILNICVTPFYMGVDSGVDAAREQVMQLLPVVILPFNIAKALLNSAIAMLLYKPLITAMRRAKLIAGKGKMEINRSSLVMLITGVVTLIASIVIFVILT